MVSIERSFEACWCLWLGDQGPLLVSRLSLVHGDLTGGRTPVADPVPTSVAIGDPGVEPLAPQAANLQFEHGTRWAKSISIDVVDAAGATRTIALEPALRFDMLGIGYQHPTWGHGVWHGEAVTAREDWTMADVAPLDPAHQHVHHLVKATMDGPKATASSNRSSTTRTCNGGFTRCSMARPDGELAVRLLPAQMRWPNAYL